MILKENYMSKTTTKYVCNECAYETYKWLGRCPSCNSWNTLVEEIVNVAQARDKMPQKSTYFYPKLITGLILNKLNI